MRAPCSMPRGVILEFNSRSAAAWPSQEKESKISYLQKAFDCVAYTLDAPVVAKAAKARLAFFCQSCRHYYLTSEL